ncbi:MAG: hypothetical protein EOR46_24975 [Mesorhizobium sp.]|nr:MAG: hypothetical protein EOR46_24975 [Mesorhizobium sp.]RWK67863.1 MAG: hypothetical protein EOR54_16705 [Mesorhizobium sp.]RWK76982.1 MAG: hypothetical protein EOR50_12530 [Mesorhizobium sp.]RWK80855.1 MAG: hypothetical protein EOR51_17570 [Mesorhizobium sp.]RWL07986.1 MAG: hypothetical protein EOR55_05140 [Mesorhizobium sp.]
MGRRGEPVTPASPEMLAPELLSRLPAAVQKPSYDRTALAPREIAWRTGSSPTMISAQLSRPLTMACSATIRWHSSDRFAHCRRPHG